MFIRYFYQNLCANTFIMCIIDAIFISQQQQVQIPGTILIVLTWQPISPQIILTQEYF